MAQLFNVPRVFDKAERWLFKSSNFPSHEQIRIADQYKLEALRVQKMSEIDSVDDVTELKNSDSYKHYSNAILTEIIEKLLKFSANDMDVQ
ncbi:hypothetical protein PENTCL1PPCAC_23283 [Pristionchus entomophagus]|uniref:Uncharacterized protein n=1 Tax=Pristionchus entomophagus TaxID=358040 RepID=A0AAV5U3W0_9BILA|nr:hypothetical protein PENTCL1PPCAC_23283 [Pristionchus entomophagus]